MIHAFLSPHYTFYPHPFSVKPEYTTLSEIPLLPFSIKLTHLKLNIFSTTLLILRVVSPLLVLYIHSLLLLSQLYSFNCGIVTPPYGHQVR